MDLSNFSKNLPLAIEPTEEALNNMNKEISDEFKCGARSIAALYRLSNTKNQLLIAKGYMDCLNEISKLVDSESIASIDDLKSFISSKKNDMNPQSCDRQNQTKVDRTSENSTDKHQDHNESIVTKESGDILKHHISMADIDDSYQFTVNNPTSHHFPKSRIAISIDHSNLQAAKKRHNMKKITNSNSSDEEIELSDSDTHHDGSDLSFDDDTNSFSKRKLIESATSTHYKKSKF